MDETAEESDEDSIEKIETSNIISSRTRGKNIDFTKANQELEGELRRESFPKVNTLEGVRWLMGVGFDSERCGGAEGAQVGS